MGRRFGCRRGALCSQKIASSSWPTGSGGNLVINGTTMTIVPGQILDYNSITIINNGVLQVFDYYNPGNPGFDSNWVIIGVKGALTINSGGQITYNQNSLGPTFTGFGPGTFTTTATTPTGAVVSSLSYTLTCGIGGNGGYDGSGTQPGGTDSLAGGGGAWGHGGGGGTYLNQGGDTFDDVGFGVSGFGNGSSVDDSAGGYSIEPPPWGQTGNSAQDDYGAGAFTEFGASGGGATRGLSGGGLYIQAATISVSGIVVDVSGSAGGAGGAGGSMTSTGGTSVIYGGGGGGGGAGGAGGKLVLRYHSGSFTSSNAKYSGGTGGVGGTGGAAIGGSLANEAGRNGFAGQNGSAGSVDIATY